MIFSVVFVNQVNLGTKDANPSSLEGVIEIMSWLQQLTPRCPDGKYKVMPCHGDQLSVERMVDAQKARSCEVTDTDRLLGLVPCPQEFHHRGITLQVSSSVTVDNTC